MTENIDRSPNDWWKNSEYEPVMAGLLEQRMREADTNLLEQRMREADTNLARNLSQTLYGDQRLVMGNYRAIHRRWQCILDRINAYRWRIVNAWLVLTGKADIE
jgi:hypothetical protein